jgi:uncharacterized membrane protein YidH (DUF202 family)
MFQKKWVLLSFLAIFSLTLATHAFYTEKINRDLQQIAQREDKKMAFSESAYSFYVGMGIMVFGAMVLYAQTLREDFLYEE